MHWSSHSQILTLLVFEFCLRPKVVFPPSTTLIVLTPFSYCVTGQHAPRGCYSSEGFSGWYVQPFLAEAVIYKSTGCTELTSRGGLVGAATCDGKCVITGPNSEASNKMNRQQDVASLRRWPLELLSEATIHMNKGSLLSLALTCRSFSVPALRTLWQRQSHIVPLIKSLPHVIDGGKLVSLTPYPPYMLYTFT